MVETLGLTVVIKSASVILFFSFSFLSAMPLAVAILQTQGCTGNRRNAPVVGLISQLIVLLQPSKLYCLPPIIKII